MGVFSLTLGAHAQRGLQYLGLSVCVSVCLLSHISPTERLFVLKTLSRTQWATKVKKFVVICLKLLRSRVMPRNISEKANMLIFRLAGGQLSPFDTQRSSRGCPTIVNNIQPCPKRCLLMLLARVGARTECTTRYSYNMGCGQFPRTRIGIVHKTHKQYAPRLCTCCFPSVWWECPHRQTQSFSLTYGYSICLCSVLRGALSNGCCGNILLRCRVWLAGTSAQARPR